MNQQELVSWSFVILGLLICMGGFVKGIFSLFRRTPKDSEAPSEWTVDWGGIGIAVLVFVIGVAVVDLGFTVADRVS